MSVVLPGMRPDRLMCGVAYFCVKCGLSEPNVNIDRPIISDSVRLDALRRYFCCALSNSPPLLNVRLIYKGSIRLRDSAIRKTDDDWIDACEHMIDVADAHIFRKEFLDDRVVEKTAFRFSFTCAGATSMFNELLNRFLFICLHKL